jgi:cytidine deaminase
VAGFFNWSGVVNHIKNKCIENNAFEIKKQQRELLQLALKARFNAQVPYSKYAVGAAVLSSNGKIYFGCNVERCSYTQTTHAEQNAIDSMIAHEGSVKIMSIVIVAAPADQKIDIPEILELSESAMPGICGHCLQIIWENCCDDPHVSILVLLANGALVSTTIGRLLPMPFGPSNLGISYQ